MSNDQQLFLALLSAMELDFRTYFDTLSKNSTLSTNLS